MDEAIRSSKVVAVKQETTDGLIVGDLIRVASVGAQVSYGHESKGGRLFLASRRQKEPCRELVRVQ